MASWSRRSVLKAAARGAAGASLGLLNLRGWMAEAQPADGESVDLGDGFRVLTFGRDNVLAVAAGDGLALVDGVSAAQSSVLTERLAALPGGGRVHTLFNTHWHHEHTGTNALFGRAGAKIVAHVNTRLWLTTDVTWPWNGETVRALPEIAHPNETFYTEKELTVGDRRVQCGYLRDCPHTDGDIYVFFPDENVMAVGDAVSGAGWPEIDWWTGGWIGGLVGGLDIILTVANEDTRFVPGRGPVLARAELVRQYEMYNVIWERLLRVLYSGGGPEEAHAAEPTKEFNEIMGEPREFVQRAFESLWAYLSPDA
ncbi:MAG TPA: MBL fold metallo-hydrolase [Gammaproteobacteria bacterium]